MILTSLKAPGTAFLLRFWPQTEFASPPLGEPAFPIASFSSMESAFHIEVDQPAATIVEVVYSAKDSPRERKPLLRTREGLWFIDLAPVPMGPLKYSISINSEKPIADPAAKIEEDSKKAPADSTTYDISSPGIHFNRPPKLVVYSGGKGAYIQYQLEQSENEKFIQFAQGARVKLIASKPGEIAGHPLFYEAAAKEFRLIESREFGRAWKDLYTLKNFSAIIANPDFNFSKYFMNSLIVATTAALLTVFICTLGGFAFAQKKFHFRDGLFAIMLSSMLVPGMIYMVPQFSITLSMGWMNTYQGMIIPHLANVFGLFLLRQYISQIPSDLFAAAHIDGATEPQVLRHIVFPLCMPIMVTLFLLVFVFQWSNFLWQLIINTADSPVLTLPVGLQQFKGQYGNDWERIMAGACFSILPITALFLALQRYFILGLTAGAVKE